MSFAQSVIGGVAVSLVLTLVASAQEFPKAGPEHAKLKPLTGEWVGEIHCKMIPEGQTGKGTYSAKLDLGGMFLLTEFKADLAGVPFHGRGTMGYDPFQKKYTGVWVDSMSPALYTTEGSWDDAGKVFTEKMQGPAPDGKPMSMRLTTEVKGDQLVFKMFGPNEDGKQELMMEIAYERK